MEAMRKMMNLYDQEEIMCSYIKRKEHDIKIETAKRCLALGLLSLEETTMGSGLSVEEVI